MVNQSLPLSYYSISAASNDGRAHSVQVYADISGEWITGNNSLVATWNTTTGDVLTHEVQLDSQSPFTEINDRIQGERITHTTISNPINTIPRGLGLSRNSECSFDYSKARTFANSLSSF